MNISNPYKFFGDIVCINLLERDDRYFKAKKLFENLNIPIRFHRVNKDKENTERGCYTSHMSVIKDAYYKGKNNVLIFEDDAMPTDLYDIEKVFEAVKFMNNNKDWDFFFFGYCHYVFNLCLSNIKKIDGYKNIVKINGLCCHAYCVNRKMMKYLVENHSNYTGIPIDIILFRLGNHYSTYPMLFKQNIQIDNDIHHSDFGWFDKIGFKIFRFIEKYICLNNLLEKINYNLKFVIIALLLIMLCVTVLIYKKYSRF